MPLCISVKLKNLKANHNNADAVDVQPSVVYIRKVKKSESKSQPSRLLNSILSVVYIRKVKKSESKSQRKKDLYNLPSVVYIRKVKKSESKSQRKEVTSYHDQRCVYP